MSVPLLGRCWARATALDWHGLRSFSSTRSSCRGERIRLPVGGRDHVHVDIRPPLTSPSKSCRQSLVICLPPGPLGRAKAMSDPSADGPGSVQHLLSDLLPTSFVITVNYRLSAQKDVFPLPIHDTYVAFDHIRQKIAPTLDNGSQTSICLYGSHIGGSLALSLALTEPTLLHAVAVSSPMANWVDLEESDMSNIASTGTKKRSEGILDSPSTDVSNAARSLRNLRTSLFPKPETFYDPFASPSLFLRSAGRDCPPDTGSLDSFFDTSSDSSLSSSLSSSSTPKRRKVLRRWPPYTPTRTSNKGEPAVQETFPPTTKILIPGPLGTLNGTDRILRHQGKEMVDLMRRACFWGRDKGFAEEMIGMEEVLYENGKGNEEMEMEMAKRAGKWLRERIESEK